ncbi:MAG: hypothetical protein HN919_02450 [Verrucomicrobia bacterium]|jgi:hypothetical protein|nr:hypothetical protein [Verrucomicrobiota bacterium]MBT7701748.1 hypothetical protein [Verrucomicrobiota bacterium]
MKRLKNNTAIFAVISMLVLVVGVVIAATDPHSWPFTTPGRYDLSSLDDAEVADGAAKLTLNDLSFFVDTVSDYSDSNAVLQELHAGPDAGVELQSNAGSYLEKGTLTSRILDGGEGNVWKTFQTRVSDRMTGNSGSAIPDTESGLIGLFHMDDDIALNYVESGSGARWWPGSFSSDAVFGSHSGYADGVKAPFYRPILFDGATGLTVTCWVNLEAYTSFGGIVTTREDGNSSYIGLGQGGGPEDGFYWAVRNGGANSLAQTLGYPVELGRWYFLAGTWSAVDRRARLYIDSALIDTGSPSDATTLKQVRDMRWMTDEDRGNGHLYRSRGNIDEIAIYDRALTGAEIRSIFLRARAAQFQVRSSAIPEFNDPSVAPFVGPDGTTNTVFAGEVEALPISGGFFTPADRYAQYRAFLHSSMDRTKAPLIQSVALLGSARDVVDTSMGDFLGGVMDGVTNNPSRSDFSYLGLKMKANGGYYEDGTYISRPIDQGTSVIWTRIAWTPVAQGLSADIEGLAGLWPLEGTPGDASGNNRTGTQSPSVGYTSDAKVGLRSGVFDAVDAQIVIPSLGDVKTVEFWLNAYELNGGIMELDLVGGTPLAKVTMTNGWLETEGFEAGKTLYVNGSTVSPRLLSGWNHVAVVLPQAVEVTSLSLGFAGTNRFRGLLDDVAAYTRELSGAEIVVHYVNGQREVAGSTKLKVRSSDSLEGLYGTAFASEVTDPNGSDLSGQSGQYVQFQVTMEGDGQSTPGLQAVQLNYNVTEQIEEKDADAFGLGEFVSDRTTWYGTELGPVNLALAGPFNTRTYGDPAWRGLWHFDEEEWGPGLTVLDSSGNGRHGGQVGDAEPAIRAALGYYCAAFDGDADYISLPAVEDILANDFTVALWFRTTSSGRAALLSNYAPADRHYTLEVNGDGSGATVPGAVSFILNDVTHGPRAVVATRTGLNDDNWHHVAGMRSEGMLHIFVDGDLVGSLDIGDDYSFLGVQGPLVGKYGTQSIYFEGTIDEVAIIRRAMSIGEIGELASAGYQVSLDSEFESPVVDGERASIWREMSWGAGAPLGVSLSTADVDLIGLWHCEALSGPLLDATANGNSGAVTGLDYGVPGAFSNAVSLADAGDQVVVTHNASLSTPTAVSAEVWIHPEAGGEFTVIDKHDGASGFLLGTDVTGKLYFRVGAATATDWLPLPRRRWLHVAGVYDGAIVRVYVDGELRGSADSTGEPAGSTDNMVFGQESGGGKQFLGRIDEVAIHSRGLSAAEVLSHYRAGASSIAFQVKVSDDPAVPGDFIGADGTTNTVFRDSLGAPIRDVLPIRQYFKARAALSSTHDRYPAILRGMRVDVTSYSTADPWVQPTDGYGYSFVGRLVSFEHTLGLAGPGTAIRYQLSGDDGVTWYYWNDTALAWDVPSGVGYPFDMSDVSDVNANIGTFYDQLYQGVGGTLRFRAFLHSLGDAQIELDEVNLEASLGQIVVTVPNGEEVGDKAWVVGTTNTIRWVKGGVVTGDLTIQFSDDDGATWKLVDANVPNTGLQGSYAWLVPGNAGADERDTCLIRISANNDVTVYDQSDDVFEIVYRYRLMAPNGGETWYIGETNRVLWHSPPGLGGQADLFYNVDGFDQLNGAGWVKFVTVPNIGAGSTNNVYEWITQTDDPDLISPHARLRISIQGAVNFHDMSDAEYTMAGIRITDPLAGTAWTRGSTRTVKWVAAGAVTNGVDVDFSSDGGTTWTNVQVAVPCVVGENTYEWDIVADNPSPNAVLRMTSRDEPRIHAQSDVFTVADIDIKAPLADAEWQTLQTNEIAWTAGGAGNKVNIYYSIDLGVSWVGIDLNVDNIDFPATNTFPWLVPDLPGDTLIKIESTLGGGELFAVSDLFKIAGIRVVEPNGGARWELAEENDVEWVDAGAGGGCEVIFSYDGGNSFVNLAGPGFPLLARSYAYTPITPTVRALARVEATDLAYAALGVAGQSDDYFTVAGIKLTAPVQDQVIKMGEETAAAVQWLSAGLLDDSVDVIYMDGTTETTIYDGTFNDESFNEVTYISGANVRDWTPLTALNPSEDGRIKVVGGIEQTLGVYTGLSSRFTLQGVRIVEPTTGSSFDIDTSRNIQWINAGFEAGARARMYLSTDGGATFDTTPLFGTDTALDLKTRSWLVALGTAPTTNAVVKLSVVNDPTTFDAYSLPFTLKGLKVDVPTVGTTWALGATETIEVLAAGAGNSVNMYYAPDGVSFDTANPISIGATISDGPNNLPWSIETFRVPSTNARIRVDSVLTDATIDSDPFTMAGILVTDPTSADIWAGTETNHIEWIAVGTSGNFKIELLDSGDSVIATVSTNVAGTTFDWPTPGGVAGTGLKIRVTELGGSYVGISEEFKIVSEPTLEVLQPTDGIFLKNGLTYQVVWTKAGGMPLTFEASYSLDNFATTNVIAGIPVFTNNQYFLDWALSDPSELGPVKVRVVNTTIPSIVDTTEDIFLVPNFRVGPPNGGEQYFALKPTVVTWFTLGDVTDVDLYYSVDPLRASTNWIKINQTGPVVGKGHNNSSQYFWEVADHPSDTVWLRVQDANYTDMYPANVEGPFDDCNATFSIIYYQIQWHVFDSDTSNHLDQASVGDSSGWSESGLLSPIIHYYPYGNFDTVWSREFFADKVIFDWLSEPSRVINVPMEKTDQAPDFNVRANFSYDSALRIFNTQSWLERGGQILDTALTSVIKIYDSEGALVETLANNTPTNGVFWEVWDVGATETRLVRTFNQTEVFFAKVVINFSGVDYSSGLTFQLRQPASDSILQVIDAIDASTSNILDEVSGVGDLIGGVSNQMVALSGQLGDGVSDILGAVGTNTLLLTDQVIPGIDANNALLTDQVIPGLEGLSNELVNIIGPSLTNIEAVVALISGQVGRKILTRPLELVRGSTNTLLYRTENYPAGQVTLDVLDAAGAPLDGPTTMTAYGTVSGIYQAPVEAFFTVDSCIIICSDPDGSDRIVVDIVADTSGNLPMMMAAISNDLATIQNQMTNLNGVATGVADLATVLDDMTNDLAALSLAVDGLDTSALDGITNSLATLQATVDGLDVSALEDITNTLAVLQGSVDGLDTSALEGMTNTLATLQASVSGLEGITNTLDALQGSVDALDVSALDGLTNSVALLQASVDALDVSALDTLTNTLAALQVSVDNLDTAVLGGLTNQLDALQASVDLLDLSALGGLTNMLGALQVSVDNLNVPDFGPLTNSINNLETAVLAITFPDMTEMSNSLGRIETAVGGIPDLTGLTNSLASLEAAVLGLNVPDIGGLSNTLVSLETAVLNLNIPDMSGLTNSIQSLEDAVLDLEVPDLSGLSNSLSLLAVAVDALDIPDLTSMSNTLNSIEASVLALPTTDLTGLSNSLVTLEAAISGLTIPDISGISNSLALIETTVGGFTNVDISPVQGAISQLQTDLAGLVGADMAAMNAALADIIAAVSGVGGADLTGLEGKIAALKTALQGVGEADLSGLDSKLSALQGAVSGLETADLGAVGRIESKLGTLSDGGGAGTFFGKLASIEGSVNSAGTSAEGAKKNAASAKTKASDAASGISLLKKALAAGDSAEAQRQLVAIRQALSAAKADIAKIPDGITLGQLQDELSATKKTIGELAASHGFKFLTGMEEDALIARGEGDDVNLNDLSTSVDAVQGSMDFMLKLLDKEVYKVEVSEQWIGVKE